MANRVPKMTQLPSFPAGENLFLHDSYHMGTRLGKDLIIMHANHDTEDCKYLILCNTKTGERHRIELVEDAQEAIDHGNLVDG